MNEILSDAWRTLTPGDRRHGPLPPLLLVLTVVTGVVDAYSYLVLGHVFVANMTGNVVFLAFAVAGAHGFSAAASLLALGAFSAGAVIGGRLSERLGRHRGRLLAAGGAVEAILVVAAVAVEAGAGSPGAGATRYVLIGVLSLALGTQNAAARAVAVPDLTTTVLTLTITGMSADSRLAGGGGSHLGRRLVATASLFIGALVGAALVLRVGRLLALIVAAVLLCLVTVTAAGASHAPAAWADGATS